MTVFRLRALHASLLAAISKLFVTNYLQFYRVPARLPGGRPVRGRVVVGLSLLSALTAGAQSSVTLAWNASTSTDVTAYNVYYGVASQTYTNMLPAGNVTNATVSGLVQGATYYFSVTALDAIGLESPHSNEISYTVPTTNSAPVNTAPIISSIPNQTLTVGSSSPALAFTVQDAETPAANLTVTSTSSNPTLVPLSGIVLSGSDTNRTVTINPAAGQTGTTTIALTVCDPSLCTTTTFVVTVNPLPVIVLSTPADGSVFTAPASITLNANVTANGHTISGVQFYNGSTLLGQAAAAPYAFTWNNVAAGTYTLTATAIYDSGSTVGSSASTVTVQSPLAPASTLPLPWQSVDIGTVGLPGSATFSSGAYTVAGAGNVSGSADNFQFLYQGLSGDGEIACQVTSASKTGGASCIGVMIRESLTSGSRYALMGLNANGQLRSQRRVTTSGSTAVNKSGQSSPPDTWVRLVRSGNTLSSYKSIDGVNWALVNSATVNMAANIYVGLAVASGSSTVLNTSTFANISVVP